MKTTLMGMLGIFCWAEAALAATGEQITELPAGEIRYEVTYTAPKDYVEVFVKKNDIQAVAQNIVASETTNSDGTYTYSLTDSGYQAGDVVATRFYSHAAGVQEFTPATSITSAPRWSKSLIYTNPPGGSPYVTELTDGRIKFEVPDLGYREYVEIFVRKNGAQFIAEDITENYTPSTGSYYFVDHGYQAGDQIEVRFYSHSSGEPAFIPGGSPQTWSSHTYGSYPNTTLATSDGTYTLGQHEDESGQTVTTEAFFDVSASYLTPQSFSGTPATTWITDHALAHSFDGEYLQNNVEFEGMYVRHCHTGEWVNIDDTIYAPYVQPLTLYSSSFSLGHYYSNTSVNSLLDPDFACPGAPAQTASVDLNGIPTTVFTWARVHFAYVVKHY